MLAHYYAATFGVMQGSATPSVPALASANTTAPRAARLVRPVAEPLRIGRLDVQLLQHLLVRI